MDCPRCGWGPFTPFKGCDICALCCFKYHIRIGDYSEGECVEKEIPNVSTNN